MVEHAHSVHAPHVRGPSHVHAPVHGTCPYQECEESQPFKYQPPLNQPGYRGCPLCAQQLPDDPAGLKRHLTVECRGNTRRGVAPGA